MDKRFSQQFFLSELFAIGFGFPVAAGYVLLLLNLSTENVMKILVFTTVTAILIEAFLSQPMNFFISRQARKGVSDWAAGRIKNKAEMADLYHALIWLPLTHGILAMVRIIFGAVIALFYMATLGIPLDVLLMSAVLSSYGAYLGGLLANTYVGTLVSPWAQALVAAGAVGNDPSVRKKWFGLSVREKMAWYLLVPILVTNLSVVFSVLSSSAANVSYEVLVQHVVGDVVVSIVTMLAFLLLTLRMITRPLANLEKSLLQMASGEGNSHERVPTDLSDEFAYVTLLVNRALDNFYDVILKLKSSSDPLSQSLQESNTSTKGGGL